MSTQKRLIVNADDLGRTAGINAGIFEAHHQGVVTSATLMVNYAAAAAVPALWRDAPTLGIGLHVALTGGPSALPPAQIPSLVDAGGHLPSKPEGLGAARLEDVLKEARAQLKRFRDLMGRDPSHLDSHHHSHRLPVVLDALVTLAWETGLPVRNASPATLARLRAEDIRTTDAFVETFFDAGATLPNLLQILDGLGPGSTELMCHPAHVDDELRQSSSYADVRERELAVLTDREVRQALQALGIKLATFADLS